jgi:hypothetical protein
MKQLRSQTLSGRESDGEEKGAKRMLTSGSSFLLPQNRLIEISQLMGSQKIHHKHFTV